MFFYLKSLTVQPIDIRGLQYHTYVDDLHSTVGTVFEMR